MTRDGFFDRLPYLCKVHGKTKEFSPDKLEAMFRYWGGLPYEVWRDGDGARRNLRPEQQGSDRAIGTRFHLM